MEGCAGFEPQSAAGLWLVLAGVCRQEDVTDANTVLSSQIAKLTVSVQNAGEVRKASKKGIIPRALETVFAF